MRGDFLALDRRRRIYALALPIIGGMFSQNLLNLVDTAMVGGLGDAALAAVGMGSFLHFMAVSFVTGMSAGVQATAARRVGEGRHDETAVPLNGGLLLAMAFALPLSIALIVGVPTLYPWLGLDAEVTRLGSAYLQLRLVGMVGVGMNFAFRGYWNAVDLSRVYLRTLVVMHVCNIVLDWGLIYGRLGFPMLGVRGAAIATVMATYLGTLLYTGTALHRAHRAGFLRAVPRASVLRKLLSTSAPAGLQNFSFAMGMTLLFWILGTLGTAPLAAANVLTNLSLVGILPLVGFGLAAASLVGQALGNGDVVQARCWGWEVSVLAMVGVGLLALPVALFPDPVLAIFLHDPNTLALARAPLQVAAATLWIDGLGTVLLNAHLGAGSTRRAMTLSVSMQWGLFLPLVYLLGPVLHFGLLAIWLANLGYRALLALMFAWSWRQGSWAKARI